jgi:hypothetical protein
VIDEEFHEIARPSIPVIFSNPVSAGPNRFGHPHAQSTGVGSSRPSGRTFVVQYTGDVDPDRGHLSGGVEHIGSGRRERFASEQEMPAFVARVLREEEGPLEQTGGT